MANLYDGVDEFRLVDVEEVVLSSPNYIILDDEPVGFGDLKIILKRVPNDKGGCNFEFGDEESLLKFDKSVGKSLINQIEDAKGSDLKVNLEYRSDGVLIYTGSLIGSSMVSEDAYISFRVKRFDFDNKLLTRWDLPINVESTEDLDGNAITPFSLRELPFHSKKVQILENRASANRVLDDFDPSANFIVENQFSFDQINNNDPEFFGYWIPDLSIVENNDIEDFFNYNNVVFGRGASSEDPLAGDLDGKTPIESKFFLFEEKNFKGEYSLNINIDAELEIEKYQVNAEDTFTLMSLFCTIELRIENASDSVIEGITIDSQTIDYFNARKNDTLSLSGSHSFNLKRGDKLYIYLQINPFATDVVINGGADSVGFRVIEAFNTTVIDITGLTQEKPSLVQGGYYKELLNKCVEYVTGSSDVIDSSYFENRLSDGSTSCGGDNFVTSGFKLRLFNQDLYLNVKSLVNLALTRFGCGFAVNGSGDDTTLLIQQSDLFFQDKKIITLEVIDSPIRKVNKDILFNSGNFGYSKYTKPNEKGTVDAFNTESVFQFPIEQDKKGLKILSDVIADGVEIERVRRNGLTNSSDSTDEKDDDIFLAKVHEFGDTEFYSPALYGSGEELNLEFDGVLNQLIVNGIIINGISNGDIVNISGSTNVTITGTPIIDLENNRTVLPASSVVSSSVIYNDFNFVESDGTTPIYTYNPERLEGFSNVTGVIDDKTVYNLDHAPSQFIIQNFKWFGGGLKKKEGTKTLKFLQQKNTAVLSKEYDSDACSLTDDLISEDQDFTLNNLRSYDTEIFTLYIYEFRARVSKDDIIRIKEAMRNESLEDINYGFIEHDDENGNLVEAYLFSMEYNPVSEEAKFITWEKNN